MSDELARLRADLEVFERYGLSGYAWTVQKKIARLEAEQADPWREAKGWLSSWRGQGDYPVIVAYIDHLTAENDRLAARVAELEADSFRRQAVIKQANELCVNDVIVDGGMIRTVTGVTFEEDQYKVVCGGAIRWYDKGNSVAVVPRPLAVASPDPDDPILDPARVLATAVGVMGEMGFIGTADLIHRRAKAAKPYRLKGDKDA